MTTETKAERDVDNHAAAIAKDQLRIAGQIADKLIKGNYNGFELASITVEIAKLIALNVQNIEAGKK
ncbi:hypothetical protein [Burkholderia gladioli]|uniref:hypothetical protein n=1 Tax=Burkholderia gladioli TaxID=28095 RepID=UPI00163FD1B0|nr:hypothetical protein [Burkholderia gladioli]